MLLSAPPPQAELRVFSWRACERLVLGTLAAEKLDPLVVREVAVAASLDGGVVNEHVADG
jgi:hypothetical protein